MTMMEVKRKVKSSQPQTQTVTLWTQSGVEKLQDCLETTHWDAFLSADTTIDDFTDTVYSYIKFCEELCLPTKQIKRYPNSKVWFNNEVRQKIKDKDIAYRNKNNNPETFRTTKLELRKCIETSKKIQRDKLEAAFSAKDSKKLWAQMSLITQYKKERQSADSEDSSLPDKLNEFYARFDRENTSIPVPLPCDNQDPPFLVTEQETRRALTRLDMNKAAGPDNIKPRLLKTCSKQLASVFTFIFNWSLTTSTIPYNDNDGG
ncbi:reverse transcriptase [Elysia marginata]|uniref:Reverse transcriptase n=1 Tax=Elysia marginata TaxID=1093978 RepID=A0AAV4G2E0_9GAST|nr:reverse transcriptase [Elysia marginata]